MKPIFPECKPGEALMTEGRSLRDTDVTEARGPEEGGRAMN